MTTTKLLGLVTFLLKIGGQNLYEDSIVTTLATIFFGFSLSSIIILGIMEPFIGEMTIDKVLAAGELFGPYYQVLY